MANNVIFKVGTKEQYLALETRSESTLYWLEDTHELYKGDILFAVGKEASAAAAGLMSAEDKTKLDSLVAGGGTGTVFVPVDATILITPGEAGETSIQVGISQDEGNILSVHDDGLFADIGLVAGEVSNLEQAIATLNGEGDGSVKKTAQDAAAAAINEFAAQVSDDGTVNTIKELVDYVAEHGPEAAEMAADIDKAQAVLSSMPDEIMSEITSVSRTETTNVAQIRLAVKQSDGTYPTSQKHGVLTLIPAGYGADGVSGAGLMSLADKQKLDSIDVEELEALTAALTWGEI